MPNRVRDIYAFFAALILLITALVAPEARAAAEIAGLAFI